MAPPRTTFDYTAPAVTAPQVKPVAATGAALAAYVSKTFSRMADEQVAKWQQAEIRKAEDLGAVAGAGTQVQYRDSDTLTAQAYNDAARKTQMSVLETTSRGTLATLQNENADNPEEFLKKSTTYINDLVKSLQVNTTTRGLAGPFEARLKFEQERLGYSVSKNYQRKVIDEAKAANENIMFSMRTDAYRTAGAIFSKDPAEQAQALHTFANASQAYMAALHDVTPDGKAVYTATEIQKRRQWFNTGFYMQAVKDYITQGDPTPEDLADILTGDLKAVIPGAMEDGSDGQIDILGSIGIDGYDQVKKFAEVKLTEQTAAAQREEISAEDALALRQQVNGINMIQRIADGRTAQGDLPVTLDAVATALGNREIDNSTANVARTMILNKRYYDSTQGVMEINAMIAEGNDASGLIRSYADQLTPDTLIALSKANTMAQETGRNELYKTHLKIIKDEFLEKDIFGRFTDRRKVREYNDFALQYMRDVGAPGADPEKIFEALRYRVDVLKTAESEMQYEALEEYIVKKDDDTIDFALSLDSLEAAWRAETPAITDDLYMLYLQDLNRMQLNQRGEQQK